METNPGHLTEFLGGFTGTCGECAYEVAHAAANNTAVSGAEMIAITHEMQQHGQASGNGATTLWALAREAERRGDRVLLEWDYSEPFQHDWVSVVRQHAGVHPVILQFANGQAATDAETGAADERGLKYHFVVILNKQADGYVVNDGDNPQVTWRYQVYNLQTLTNAVVCGVLVLDTNAVVGVPVVNVPGLGPGFQVYVDSHKVTAKCVMTDRKLANGWIVAFFDSGLVLVWDGHNVIDNMASQVLLYFVGEIEQLKGEVQTLSAHQGVALPPEAQGVLAEVVNILAPSAHAFADVTSLQKKLGF